ncbi:hypothetical protein SELMODRAFT_137590 [Selaginella moellendorffii]|uniref:PPM-type phosphatase domain-containing protein n=1 Tax=Selaginella moellendorffii TaxID=88036 RepID=D8TDV9_SELML|nr:hypothetical protein SELMODRAFT_137590 [Selaginella moellendorffii]
MGLEKVLVEHGHCKEEEDKVLFVGVYDGHKGSLTSKLCADNLHKDLETRMNKARRMFGIASAQKAGSTSSITHQSLNKNWLRMVGSTAIVALVYKERIVVANAGNCRCVLSRDKVAVDLSRDHSPELEMERKRIEACHGFVENGRLYHCNREANLKVSRAIGCLIFKSKDYKKCPKVICEPEVTEVDIEHGDEFLVVASDGIWSAMSSQEVIDFVGERVQCCKGRISDVCSQLIHHCLDKEACSRDNMTVVIIKL